MSNMRYGSGRSLLGIFELALVVGLSLQFFFGRIEKTPFVKARDPEIEIIKLLCRIFEDISPSLSETRKLDRIEPA